MAASMFLISSPMKIASPGRMPLCFRTLHNFPSFPNSDAPHL